MNDFLLALAALLPSVGVGAIFWYVMRSLVNADRTERAALARMDAQDAERAAKAKSARVESDI
ncbi:hypothetical protein AB6N24_14625 [Cellulomonas sp. 179-A 4D5 NHS]|jgi:hypothetical protein|uniref:hypothetical protein n=1 Tax=Cellulomonas sp. 179-A 4D5 NHS TaxID=3142378 RepID=UPI0039A2E050